MAAHGYAALASPAAAAATPSAAAAEHPVFLCLATDVLGAKVNYEVAFASAPTLAAVVPVAQSVFDAAYAAQGSARRFAAQRWQLYDDDGGRWVSLRKEPWASAPLPHGAQVYALQEGWEAEEQAPIPNPTQPPQPPTPTPTPRQRSPAAAPPHAAEAPLAPATPATPAAAVAPAAQRQPSLAERPRVEAAAAAVVPAVVPVAAAASAVAALSSPPQPQASKDGGGAGEDELEEVCLGEGGLEDDASKAAALFHELNVRGDGAMDVEEFSRGLRRMDMPFTEESLREVFEKADLDRDGRLSKGEWSALLKAQPNLCDSLYFRSREYWADVQLQQGLSEGARTLQRLQAIEADTRAVWVRAQEGLERCLAAKSDREEAVQRKQAATRAAEAALEAAGGAIVACRTEASVAESQLARSREREADAAAACATAAQRTAALHDAAAARSAAARAADAAAASEEAAQAAVQAEAETLRAGRLAKAEAFRVAHAAEQEAKAAVHEAEDATRRAAQAAASHDSSIATCEKAVVLQEQEVAMHRGHAERVSAVGAEENQVLQLARRSEEDALRCLLEAQRTAAQAAETVQAREAEAEALAERRALAVQNEQRIIEQEIRLRRQRNALEENEARLRAEHRAVMDVTLAAAAGAGSVARTPRS